MLLGRPLDLVFDIYTDPGMELDVACVRASGQAGETSIDSSRLRITAQPVIAGRPPSVRMRSSMAVLEPIVTLRLSVGCASVISRSYDFFAEVPTEVPPSRLPLVIAPAAAPTAAPLTAPVAAPVAPPAAQAPHIAETPQAPQPPKPLKLPKPPKPPKEAKQPAAPAPTAPTAPASVAAAPPPRSRLQVEPLGDWPAQPPALRLTPSLQQLPQEGPSEQRTQAAARWQSINSAAEYVEQTQARLLQQQAEIDAARANRAKMQQEMTDLQQRIEQLDSERPSTTLMYVLLGLLVLVFALLAWLWQRLRGQEAPQRTEPDWNGPATPQTKGFAPAPAAASDPEPSGLPPLAALEPSAPLTTLDLLAPRGPALSPAAAAKTPPLSAAAPLSGAGPATEPLNLSHHLPLMAATLAPALATGVRMLHPEQLFDLQQQADFFISVGEHDQAIEVMQKHIAENETASPLMYLELLRLYHSLSRRDDFKQLRAQFQQHFNALVPEFAAFNAVGRNLLDYPEAAARIEAVWSDTAVLALLESYIFCSGDGHNAAIERFDLPAYDDLLLLYAVANTTPASARGAPPPRERTMPYADAVAVPPSAPSALSAPFAEPLPELESSVQLPALDAAQDMDMDMDLDLELFMGMGKSGAAPPALDGAPAPSPSDLDNLIEYDSQFLSDKSTTGPATEPAPAPADDELPWVLDLDLSEPDFLGLDLSPSPEDDLPALAATPAPAPGQPIGFGASSDRFEARFELDESALGLDFDMDSDSNNASDSRPKP